MKITIRVEGANDAHTTLRVFINGRSNGLLTMDHDEAAEFMARLTTGVQLRERKNPAGRLEWIADYGDNHGAGPTEGRALIELGTFLERARRATL